jgi:hypothetical protein
MAQISVGAALGEGFGLIARRPLAVVAWGLIPTALQMLALAMLAPAYLSMFGAMAHGAAPSQAMMMTPQYSQMSGLVQLLNLVQFFVSAVVYCAVFRAVVHPEQSAFAYLRVGMAELFLALLIFGAAIVMFVAMIVIMIPVGILIAIVAAASRDAGVGFAIIIPIVILALLIAMMVFGLRFSLVGPMLVDDGKFHLFESWTLSRGRLGSLLLLALGLFGVSLAIDIVILVLLVIVAATAIGAAGGMERVRTLLQHSPEALLSQAWPFLIAYGIVSIPIAGCVLAIVGAPFARVYLDLKSDASEAFA